MTRRMARLVLLAEAPSHLDHEQTEAWLRSELATLVAQPGIQRGSLSRLESVSARFSRGWDWLIELECAPGDAERAACDSAFGDLFGDLRLIGMRPTVALANRPVELTPRQPG
jgi:hypothetical protein